MQQLILPTIPIGATEINGLTSVWRDELRWTYFLGCLAIFSHPPDDLQQFRFFTSHLINSGRCRQIDIMNTFGVSKSSVARSLKKLREEGAPAFFKQRAGHRNGKIFSPEVLEKAQQFLNQGWHRCEVAKELGIKSDTFRKAIYDGRLHEMEDKPVSQTITTKSTRDKIDADAAENMGTGCVNTVERSLAAFGMSDGALVDFLPSADVPMGGVLCALPALLLNGLLDR
jgi:transposase